MEETILQSMALFLYLNEWNAHRAAVHTEYIQNSVIKMYQHNASCNYGCGKKKSPVLLKTQMFNSIRSTVV